MSRGADGEKWWRAGLLLISIGLHAGLFAVLMNVRYTITIYEDRSEVRNVIITPEDRLMIPQVLESESAEIPEEILVVGRLRADAERRDLQSDPPTIGAVEPGGSTAGAPAVEGEVPVPRVRFSPSSSFRFNLDWATRAQSTEEPYFDLAVSPTKGEEHTVAEAPPSGPEPGDLRRYIRRGSLLSPRAKSSAEAKASPRAAERASYDLSPWADQVIGRIQDLWRLDAAQSGEPRGRVEVRMTVARDGTLKALDILRSSDDEGLDRAALRAVENNLPLPPLPDDFPLDRLELRLVFEYDY